MVINGNNRSPMPYAGDHFASMSAMLLGIIVFFFALCLMVSTYQRAQVVHDSSNLSDAPSQRL